LSLGLLEFFPWLEKVMRNEHSFLGTFLDTNGCVICSMDLDDVP